MPVRRGGEDVHEVPKISANCEAGVTPPVTSPKNLEPACPCRRPGVMSSNKCWMVPVTPSPSAGMVEGSAARAESMSERGGIGAEEERLV